MTSRRPPPLITVALAFGLAASIACGLEISGEGAPEVDAGLDRSARLPEPGDADVNVDARPRPDGASLEDATSDALACGTPAPETCNGLDDNCDGVVDDPCPRSVALGAPGDSFITLGGASGSVSFDDTCPAEEVLIGVTVQTNDSIRQLFGRCGRIRVVENRGTDPFTYSLVIAPGASLPNHGTEPGTTEEATCPEDSVVVGISGRYGAAVDAITLICASLSLSGSSPSFGLKLGLAALGGTVGGAGGSSVSIASCPSGRIVTRMSGRATNRIERVGFACSAPSIVRYGDL